MRHIELSHELLTKIEDNVMPMVLVESPLAAPTPEGLARNKKYARACLRDCLVRGEAPYASHLLYAQEGLINDDLPEERALGIHAGLVWGAKASKTIVYTDLGISSGMERGIQRARKERREIEYRELGLIPTISPLETELETMRQRVEQQLAQEDIVSGRVPLGAMSSSKPRRGPGV